MPMTHKPKTGSRDWCHEFNFRCWHLSCRLATYFCRFLAWNRSLLCFVLKPAGMDFSDWLMDLFTCCFPYYLAFLVLCWNGVMWGKNWITDKFLRVRYSTAMLILMSRIGASFACIRMHLAWKAASGIWCQIYCVDIWLVCRGPNGVHTMPYYLCHLWTCCVFTV